MIPELVTAPPAEQELREAFNWICDPADWRAPVDAEVSCEDPRFRLVYVACEHFTATTPTIEHIGGPRFRVRAVGYRNGPAGP